MHLRAYQGLLYFNGSGTESRELWYTDGTLPGTDIAFDLRATGGSNPEWMTVYKGLLYFAADDGNGSETELWATDGSASGMTMAVDLATGAGSYPYHFMVY
ncbi:hypothetical protein MUP29_10315 [bacterium]|nr:hypothetical protein [bacterium]